MKKLEKHWIACVFFLKKTGEPLNTNQCATEVDNRYVFERNEVYRICPNKQRGVHFHA